MKPFTAGLLAYCAGVAVPTLVVAALSQSLLAVVLVGGIGGLYALVIGVPLFLVLRKFRLVTWWSALIVGFVAVGSFDAFPILKHWRFMAAQGYLNAMINGAVMKGLGGAAGGFAFWSVWTVLMPPNKAPQDDGPRPAGSDPA